MLLNSVLKASSRPTANDFFFQKGNLQSIANYRHFGTATVRDRDDSAPEATFRELGTDSSGVGYRQFGSWIKMKY